MLDGAAVRVPAPGKPTAVYFFATGCASCVPPLRALGEVAEAHSQVVYLPVSISPYDDAESIRGFLAAAEDGDRAAAHDPKARLAQTLKVNALIVYDAAGAEVYRGVDPPESEVKAAFAKASAQS
ncbi:MAG: hypothetical protein GEU94_21635 [Micromonosporaceae bacterium]|nr:hypothetical protein [Micromonosporaceae bacterium]